MAEIVGGLFGVTPEALQMQREKQSQQEALNFAQLQDPFARANYQIYQGASGLGRQISGLLGAQDPEMAKAAALQGILKQADTTSPEGLATLARTLAGQGFGQQALQVSQQAQGMMKTQSEISKNMRERAAADPVQQLIRTGKYTPASVASYAESGKISDLDTIDKADPTALSETTDGVFLINKQTGEKIARIGGAPQRGTNVTVKQDEAVTKSNVEAFGKLRDSGIQAGQTIEAVKTIKPLIDQSFAGFASDSKLTAGQISEAFGIPIKGTSETEQLRSLQNNLKIGNSTVLKGALSDKDMAILGEAIGQGSVTKAGLKSIMNNIEKDALISQRQYQKANEYQQQGKLSQYDFVKGSEESRTEVNTKLKRLAELERKARGQ
jgi:hypothetical protein